MALKESFETYDGTGFTVNGTTWRMQSFTTTSAYAISDVALYGWKYGSPGDVTFSIRAVDGAGKPTGGDLATATLADSEFSALPALTWVTFTFVSPYSLSDSTQYAIVVRAPNGDGSNYYAPFGYSSSGYAGGGSALSSDSGSSWGAVSGTNDMNFRVYGSSAPSKPTNPSPTDSDTGIQLNHSSLTWDDGGGADTFEIYLRVQGDSWSLVGAAQAGTSWTIPFPTLDYGIVYEWRVDATNAAGTTTGDTWSFTAQKLFSMTVTYYYTVGNFYYRLLPGGSPPPGGVEDTDYTIISNPNFLSTTRILIAAANNKIWHEDI